MRCCLWVFALLLSCNKDGGETSPGDSGIDTGGAPDCDEVYTWETIGAPMVYTWCTGCHSPDLGKDERQGAPLTVNLTTHEDVQSWAAVIEIVIWSTDPEVRMPPSGGVSDQELTEFQTWLDCGLPE